MGQRLNIEIKSKGKVVANCYYHWSAYTRSALQLTKEIISNFDSIQDNDDVKRAVKLLESTGAGYSDRDAGLIATDEEEMNDTRYREEGRVTIDMDNKTFDFNVFFKGYDEEDTKDILEEHPDIVRYDDFPLENIPFEKIYEYTNMIYDINIESGYFMIGDNLYRIIE